MIRNISTAFAALLISSAALFAQGGSTTPDVGGIEVSKKTVNHYDGTYTINIEAFVTGEELTSSSLVSEPVDAVLVLDVSGSMEDPISDWWSPSRISSLKSAVKKFLDTMKANQDAYNDTQTDDSKKITHRVSIVTFASDSKYLTYRAKSTTYTFTLEGGELNSDNLSRMKSAVDNLYPDGATEANKGMSKAYDQVNSYARDNAKKLVVFFTDGVPTTGTKFSASVANNAIDYAYKIKQKGASVYAVSVIPSLADNPRRFLNHLSSNFPNAQKGEFTGESSYDKTYDPGEGEWNGDYVMIAPDQSSLELAFITIARDISSGGASIELDSDTITADIVMSGFQISKTFGTVATNNIDVYIRELKNISGKTYTWSTEKFVSDTIKVDVKDDAEGNHVVSVTGFDFSRHWCGLDYMNGSATGLHPGGQKLCLDIELVPNPESSGGYIATNHEDSGIYIKDENDEPKLLKSFGLPPSVYAPCDIVIERSGLAPGESAVYEVVRYKEGSSSPDPSFKREVILTAGTDSTATATVKGDVVYVESETEFPYSYEVIENPTGSRWDFNYTTTSATSIKQTLYEGDKKTNVFSFTSTKKSGDNALGDTTHDEEAKNNKFKRLNTTL